MRGQDRSRFHRRPGAGVGYIVRRPAAANRLRSETPIALTVSTERLRRRRCPSQKSLYGTSLPVLCTCREGLCPLDVESARVQVFGRRRGRANHTARRPASEKRQGTKSRKWGTRPCREPLWGFGDEPSHEEPRLRSLACSAYIEPCVFACWRKSGKQIGHEVGGIVGEQAEHPP